MALTLLYITIFFFFFLCLILSFVILIQESKSMGFGASFGGDSGNSVFGTSTPEVLKKFTAILATLLFVFCLILSYWAGKAHTVRGELPMMNPEIESIYDQNA